MTAWVILFLLVFPKGGFKIGDLPITWGYLLLGVVSLFLSFSRPLRVQASRLQALQFLIPFQGISALTIAINGTENISFLISFVVTFFFLPVIFYLLLSSSIDNLELGRFFRLFCKGIFFISSYGICLFFYRIYTGHFFEIPFLTVNGADVGLLDLKCNLRSGIFKLVSTYNNGNLYGICLLMCLPLYSHLERSMWKRVIFKLSLLLTLSRTVWFGLIINEVLFAVFIQRKLLKPFAMVLFILLSVSVLLSQINLDWDFIWDRTLGGRIEQLASPSDFSLFSSRSFYGIHEMIYPEMLSVFGLIGLASYLVAVIGPMFVSYQKSTVASCIRLGLVNYLILSCSDGAILLIPVMAFYWFFSSLLQSKKLVALPL